MYRFVFIPCLALTCALGCAGEILDVEVADADASATGGAGDGSAGGSSAVGGSSSTGGTWFPPAEGELVYEGTLELDGSIEPMRVVFRPLGSTTLAVNGTVTIGEGPPPPVDPELVYPPQPPSSAAIMLERVDGFAYSLDSATLSENQLHFSLQLGEAFESWCEAQTVFAQEDDTEGAYGCIPWINSGLDCSTGDHSACVATNGDGETMTLSWDKWAMCGTGGTCSCDLTSCAGKVRFEFPFALVFAGDQLNGMMNDAPVHLVLQ